MAKPELGIKRQCASCGAKFYDLNKDPIVCPKCSTVFVVTSLIPAALAARGDDEAEVETTGPEMVSLDEVVAAEKGKDIVLDDDLDVDDDVDHDDTFLEEEEENDGDVSDLIDSDIGDDEET